MPVRVWDNVGMTERKPTGVSFESWVDRQIREASERGEFDNLPGAGQSLPGLDKPHDELWWVRRKVRDEGLQSDVLLPEPLKLRKQIAALPETVRELPREQAVRDAVRDLNERILDWLRRPTGPRIALRPVDADEIVAGWQAARKTPAAEPATVEPIRHRRRWFRRHRASDRR